MNQIEELQREIDSCVYKYRIMVKQFQDLKEESDNYKSALNRIGMLGMSELAYTSDYTEEVRTIVRKALGLKEKFP